MTPFFTKPRLLLAVLSLALAAIGCGRTTLLTIDDPVDGGTDTGIDTGLPPECTRPADCDDGIFCNGIETCRAGRCELGPEIICDDGDPCSIGFCDEAGRTCRYEPDMIDADGDGFPNAACGGRDCDDTRPEINPAATELCDDGIDNNCNFAVDCADGACTFAPFCMCVPEPERCDDGRDNDCDGLVDCDDFECRGFPGCGCVPRMEVCFNGEDDDCNGLVDCMDPICFPDPACCMPRPEDCGNMFDDNCNGLFDCEDPECAMDPICSEPCPDADLGSRVGARVAFGSTSGRRNTLGASCAGGARSPDIAYSWRAPLSGRWSIDTVGSDYDTALHVHVGGCFGPEIACDDDSGPGTQSRVQLSLRRGQEIIIVVDGFASGSAGNYVLNIAPAATEIGNCADGIDNDRDGATDCMDPDCAGDPACLRMCPERDIASEVGLAVARGNTFGQGDDRAPSCAMSAAPDVAHFWTAPRNARYRFDTRGSSFDTVLYLLDGSCSGPELACDDDRLAPASRITRNIRGGTRLVIVVDGDGLSGGDYQLNIRAFEGAFCSDGIDNDLDGATDCADTECTGRPECCVPAPEICDDMIDQDCDGLVDCADPNCAASPVCCVPSPEDCANMRDDDCDGLVDCVDPSCAADPVC